MATWDSQCGIISIGANEFVVKVRIGQYDYNHRTAKDDVWGFRALTISNGTNIPFYQKTAISGRSFTVPKRDRAILKGSFRIMTTGRADFVFLDVERELPKIIDAPTTSNGPCPMEIIPPETSKHSRRAIPKAIRDQVWDQYMGNVSRAPCYCCNRTEIRATSFECGHVVSVANGGETSVSNLRPICVSCNRAMGTTNLEEYKRRIAALQK